jgi:hypothetical protein
MRDWFALELPEVSDCVIVEDPEVSAFAIDLAFEAGALLDSYPVQDCSCVHPQLEASRDQADSAERRGPFSWFGRPRRRATDTPFAN